MAPKRKFHKGHIDKATGKFHKGHFDKIHPMKLRKTTKHKLSPNDRKRMRGGTSVRRARKAKRVR